VVAGAAVACLGALGVVGARLGGAAVLRPTARIVGWGVLAMAATALIGRLVGVAV
jgi:VIT1/CCC1 family predicted Fe2+/Mn2+ transporter